MLIIIQDWWLYAAVGFSMLMLVVSLFIYLNIKRKAPDAFVHVKANDTGQPVCRVHYRGGQCKDYLAIIAKEEKEIGTPYWTVPTLGLKFKPKKVEFIEGTVRCANYFENMTEAVAVEVAVAYSQLKDYFAKIGIPIDGVENVALYISSELEKMPDKKRAMMNARVNSEETKRYLNRYLDAVHNRDKEIRSLRLESGLFIWDTCMKALDETIAYTSSNMAHTKETIRAALMRQEENKRKDLMLYAIITVTLAIAGIILLFGIKAFTGG